MSTKYIQCFKNQIEYNRPAVDYLTLVGKEKIKWSLGYRDLGCITVFNASIKHRKHVRRTREIREEDLKKNAENTFIQLTDVHKCSVTPNIALEGRDVFIM